MVDRERALSDWLAGEVMTVCIAAICDGNFIIGASDRMLTAGDIQYEPPAPKVLPLTNSIVVMSSGDASFQKEILFQLSQDVNARIATNPAEWLSVYEVAWLYIEHRNEAKLRRAESVLLKPLGLDRHQFLYQQSTMSASLVEQLARDLLTFSVPSVACIIVGVDTTGPHIYTVYDGQLVCCDATGFACVGSGATHASSQFMLAQHAPNQSSTDTLLIAYNAKRRSEIAPGVGEETDLFVIGPRVGTFSWVNPTISSQLEAQYVGLVEAEKKAANDARAGIAEYLENLVGTPAADQGAGAEPTADASQTPSGSESFESVPD
jgi:20S proteasome alpha/beta subunit